MKTRKLGKSDLELTTVGLGAWAIGGSWMMGWGHQDDKDSITTIHTALDQGINWVDTAAVYGLGRSEEVVGKALKGRRDKVILATKCGLVWDSNGKVDRRLSAKSVRRELEDSLRRLDTDYIDLYQIHWPTEKNDHIEVWEEMTRFKEEGKIRFAGVSNFSSDQMNPLRKIMPIASDQPPFSLMNRDIETDVLPFAREENIGIVAYGPMHHGLLTGKYTPEKIAELPDDDWRTKSSEFQNPRLAINLDFVNSLSELAKANDLTPAQLAIGWVVNQPGVTSAIVGMRKPEQAKAAIPAADWTMDDTTKNRLAELVAMLDERKAALEDAK